MQNWLIKTYTHSFHLRKPVFHVELIINGMLVRNSFVETNQHRLNFASFSHYVEVKKVFFPN